MAVSETQIDLADEAACKRDGMFRDIFNQEERRDLIQTILTAVLSDQAGGWQDISTAPENHLPVQVYGPYGQIVAFRDVTWAWWPIPAVNPLGYKLTHWQPLPAAPPPSTAGESQSG
jgi:hypothetical protein